MDKINQLYEITLRLYNFLDNFPDKDHREEYIVSLNQVLDERAEIIRLLPKEFTDEEIKLGLEINKLNHEIGIKLDNLFAEIKMDLRNIKRTQQVNDKYNQNYSFDGMFFDKRK